MEAIEAEAIALPDGKLHNIYGTHCAHVIDAWAEQAALPCASRVRRGSAYLHAYPPHLMRTPSTLRAQSSSKMSYSRRNPRIVPTFSQRAQPQTGKASGLWPWNAGRKNVPKADARLYSLQKVGSLEG